MKRINFLSKVCTAGRLIRRKLKCYCRILARITDSDNCWQFLSVYLKAGVNKWAAGEYLQVTGSQKLCQRREKVLETGNSPEGTVCLLSVLWSEISALLARSCSQVWSEQGGSELVCPLLCRECEQLIGAGERKAVGACSSKSRRVPGPLPKAEKEGVLRNRVTMWGILNGTGNVESLIWQKSVASISLDILQCWLLHSSKLWKGWHELEEVVE